MDNAQGAGPSSFAGSAGAGGDWRAQLQPEARGRIVNKIMEVLKKRLLVPLPQPAALSEIRGISVQFEEKIFNAAVSQSDYLRKITLKMLSMSHSNMNTQENLQNGQVIRDQRPNNQVSNGSTSRTGNPGAGDLEEELHQMNKTLKDQYRAGLGALYEISRKLHGDHHVARQDRVNPHEEVNFKAMLERSLDSVQINKKCIEPSHEGSIPMYKRQIMSILNSEEWIPEQTTHHSTVQASSTSSTYERNLAICEK